MVVLDYSRVLWPRFFRARRWTRCSPVWEAFERFAGFRGRASTKGKVERPLHAGGTSHGSEFAGESDLDD